MRVGRIPYINCYPVYDALDCGAVASDAELVSGVPSELNRLMADGALDISVVSAVEYAQRGERYLLLPDLAISCDGPVRSVMLFSRRPAAELDGGRVIVSRSSMTSVALLRLLFDDVWGSSPEFVPGDAEVAHLPSLFSEAHDARLVIGDAALLLGAAGTEQGAAYPFAYDLGAVWKSWTGLPFVFAVWVARRTTPLRDALAMHATLIDSRDWGLAHLPRLAERAATATGVDRATCLAYLSGLDYRLSEGHVAGLTEFFGRLADHRLTPRTLTFLPAA